MIIIKIPENNQNILKKDIMLQKKMIQLLIYLTKYLYNNNYYNIYDFKNICINIVTSLNKLIDNLCDIINISTVKLNCVVAITNDNEISNIGDCGDTSVTLTLKQFLYYQLNSIVYFIINCCTKINDSIIQMQYNINNIIIDNHINSCIRYVKDILEILSNISIQSLHPICEKFDYRKVDHIIHSSTNSLLNDIINHNYSH